MIGKLLRSPTGAVTAVVAAITGVTAFGNTSLEKFENFTGFSASASEVRVSCFDKEQVLDDGTKQGVSICFEDSLDKSEIEFYSVDGNGVRSSVLSNEMAFMQFINLADLSLEVNQAEGELEEQVVESVKGVNVIKDSYKDNSSNSYKVRNSIIFEMIRR